jgi:hypothetical protein
MEFHIAQILIFLPTLGIIYGVWIISSAIVDHFINNNERNQDHE